MKVTDSDITWLRQESKSNLQKAKTIRREYRNMEKSSDVAKSAQAQLRAMLAQAGATVVDGIGPAAGGVLSELDLSPVHTGSPLNSKGAFQETEIGESTVASESAASAAFASDSEEDDSDNDSEGEDELESSDEEEDDDEEDDSDSGSDDEESDEEEEEDSDASSQDSEEEDDSDHDDHTAEEDIVGSMILNMHRPEAGGRRLDIKWVWCAGGVPEALGAATGSNPAKKATIMTGEGVQSLKRVAVDAFSKRLGGVTGEEVCLAYRDEDGDVIALDSNEDVQLMYACFMRISTDTQPVRKRVMVAPVTIQAPAALGVSESKVGLEEDTVHSSGSSDVACAIKHWKQGRLLGTGSFGKVFEGLDVDSGRQVAIKTVKLPDHLMLQVMSKAGITAHDAQTGAAAAPMPTKAAADDSLSGSTGGTSGSSLDELVGEIRLMQSLSHPNIVAYLGSTVIMAERKLLIFMEFASGGSLMSVLERYRSDSNPGLPADIVSRYTRHVLEGLVYLHSLKIVHRDLKPANVLLDAGVAKLADFGCSKVAAETSVETSSAIGTALYCAPELLSEAPSYGTASDIWSLGITVAQLFNGELPWSGNVAHAVYKVCFSSDMPELPASAPSSAVDFVTACLAREASSRPTAEDLLEFDFLK